MPIIWHLQNKNWCLNTINGIKVVLNGPKGDLVRLHPSIPLSTSIKTIMLSISGDYNHSSISGLGSELSGALTGPSLHLQSHGESHDQLQQYQQSYPHQQHYPTMPPGGDFCNYGPIYGSSAYSNYVKCRTNPYQRPSPPPSNVSSMPMYYPGEDQVHYAVCNHAYH